MADKFGNILGNTRILLIDNDESVRLAMRDFFADITQLFTTVDSAEEALPILGGPFWDVAVCNLRLPNINGLQLCNQIRQQRPKSKLILATKYRNAALLKKADDIGISKIIESPMIPEKLLSALIELQTDSNQVSNPGRPHVESGTESVETVSILELDRTMIITAFIRFDQRFENINPSRCTWIQYNFNGASAVVNRKGQRLDLAIEKIEPGDDIIKIHRLPVALMKLTFVRPQLIKDLKKRGFLAFEVKRKPRISALNRIKQDAIRRTEVFLQEVSDNISVRYQLSDSMKGLFSTNNTQAIDTYDLVNHVDRITERGAAQAISAIAVLKKGDQLYTHCVDVGAIFLTTYSHWVESGAIESVFGNDAEIMLSAILHDIGMIFLPREIIESTEPFASDSPQMRLIREHPKDGAQLISGMDLPEEAVNMALYHHVKIDNAIETSYPPVDDFGIVSIETRLLTIVDTFQSIVGMRPSVRSWPPANALKYLDVMAGIEFDQRAWVAFREALGWYPVGSMVELNDGSKAFVVERAYLGLYRPSVVVTRNAEDEELTHNTFFDLNTEKDIFIKKGLDHYEIYGDEAINRFVHLQVS